jgi:TIR domain
MGAVSERIGVAGSPVALKFQNAEPTRPGVLQLVEPLPGGLPVRRTISILVTMADIFVSHIHEEADAAEALTKYLRDYGFESFLSSERWQIRAGDRWFDRITEELAQAKIVLLMLSKRSVDRPWINFEAGRPWSQKKITIPVCFGGLEPEAMPRPYSDLQGIDLATGAYTLVLDCHAYLKEAEPYGRFQIGRSFTAPPPIPDHDASAILSAVLKRFVPRMPPPGAAEK